MGPGAPSSSAARGAAASPVKPGDILAGKYRVERVLGVGGMGVVVAATHIDLLERRAIKFMLAAQLGDAEAVERFLREARASSRLKSEHVAKVHDVGRLENGAPYLVMEYLTGGDLRALLKRRGAVPAHEAALYVLQACEALAEAHGSNIVHRDLKPENLFLTKRPDGTPSIKVLDFGISKVLGAGADLAITSTQAIMGSPYYMSPEQLRASRDVDTRADIWSLGVILYQLVTNNLPFSGANLTALISAVIYGKFVPASEVRVGLSSAIDPIILRCLERDVDHRYPSVAELADDLLPLAPSAARESVERIMRLLRPNSSSPSDRLVMGSYDAPGPAQPSSAEPETVPRPAAGNEAATHPPAVPLSNSATRLEGSRSHTGGAAGAPANAALAVSGSVTQPAGNTMRSGDVLATSAGTTDPRGTTSADWAHGVPSVRVVVQPSRAPWIILAVGGAVSLVIVSVAFLVTRGATTPGDARERPPPSTSLGEVPSTATAVAPVLPPTITAPALIVTPTAGEAPLSSASAALVPSARHLMGKLPTKPTSTGEPAKPPAAGDPFGAGRQ
jgi:serine/threonine protein kinase